MEKCQAGETFHKVVRLFVCLFCLFCFCFVLFCFVCFGFGFGLVWFVLFCFVCFVLFFFFVFFFSFCFCLFCLLFVVVVVLLWFWLLFFCFLTGLLCSDYDFSDVDAFSQVFPEDKFNVVALLQRKNQIVGMTGKNVV